MGGDDGNRTHDALLANSADSVPWRSRQSGPAVDDKSAVWRSPLAVVEVVRQVSSSTGLRRSQPRAPALVAERRPSVRSFEAVADHLVGASKECNCDAQLGGNSDYCRSRHQGDADICSNLTTV
jgi:hypothetical protein